MQTTTRYCKICGTDVEAPADVLASLAEAPSLVAEAVRAAKPGGGDGWSPAEVAAHLADTEVVKGWRVRQTLAEDEPAIQPYDQDRWAQALWYERRSVDVALRTFAVLREANLELLRALSEADWERPYNHQEHGRLTLRDFVYHIADHDLAHLRQIHGG